MKDKKWITTEQMLEALRNEPDVDQQYCHYICCGILRSTHWLMYSSKKDRYGDSINIHYDWYNKNDFLKIHAGEWWMRED